ncbi:hypothetical protein ABK040_011027 [Willaertia magna]
MSFTRSGKTILSCFLFIFWLGFFTSAIQADITFYNCPLHTEQKINDGTNYLDPNSNFPRTLINAINEYNHQHGTNYTTKAECTSVPLPLNPNDENSVKINIFVKRLRVNTNTEEANNKKALWLIQGGPGSSSTILEYPMDLLSKLLGGNVDIYTLDPRGSGRSHRLGCDASQAETIGSVNGVRIAESEWPECSQAFQAEYNTNNQYYSSVNAAIDLFELIKEINIPNGQDVFVYGVSYGTMVVTRFMRYLELKGLEGLVKGVVMDSVMSTKGPLQMGGRLTADQLDEYEDATVDQLLTLCNTSKLDTTCHEKLGNDPVQYMLDVFQSVYVNGTCKTISNKVSSYQMKALLGRLIDEPETRIYIPAVLYRLERCDEDLDVPTVLHLYNVFFGEKAGSSANQQTNVPLMSAVQEKNIIYSEIWNPAVTTQELIDQMNHTLFASSGESVKFAKILDLTQWKTYTLSPDYENQVFSTNTPVLLLNGDLDALTPLESARTQSNNIGGNTHRLIEIPYASHMTAFFSENKISQVPCGMQLLVQFVMNPDINALNTSCANENVQFNFTGSPEINLALFGVEDIYEDAYEPPEIEKTVNLYLFIGVEAGTVVISVIVVCCLIYYIVQLRDKEQAQYEDIDAQN